MRSVLILSFSGTGNTKFVVDALVQSFVNKGITATSYPLEKLPFEKNLEALLAVDLIGIAFPVYAWNPPLIVEQIIKKLPATTSRECFILKTSGSPFAMGGTTTRLKRILRSRNWNLKHETLVPMPSNLGQRYSDAFIKLNAEMALLQAAKIAETIIDRDWKLIPANRWAKFACVLMRVERMGGVHFGHFLKVDSNCIKCGKCVRECPTRNIKFHDSKFTFGWRCAFCMRCSFNCPVQAITHKHFKKSLMVKPPYNLQQILDDPLVMPADITDDKIPNMKDFRQFWFRFGIIE